MTNSEAVTYSKPDDDNDEYLTADEYDQNNRVEEECSVSKETVGVLAKHRCCTNITRKSNISESSYYKYTKSNSNVLNTINNNSPTEFPCDEHEGSLFPYNDTVCSNSNLFPIWQRQKRMRKKSKQVRQIL